MKVLGIDIGTTTISLVVLDPEQKKVWESRTISNGTFMETAQEWERIQDVNKIVEKTREVLEELLHAYPEVSSIGLTGQMPWNPLCGSGGQMYQSFVYLAGWSG